ncbi:MAG: hypothetical protein WCW31_01955 [Patescibacteria group bacterium]
MFQIPKPLVIAIAVLPWVAGLICIVWILALRFPASGIFETQTDFSGNNAYIYPFLPGERTTSPGKQADGWTGQRIISDPVYLNVHTPGPYQTMQVSMEYRTLRQPLLELGIVRDEAGTQLDMQPWYSEILDQSVWRKAVSAKGKAGYVKATVSSTPLDQNGTEGLAIWDATSTVFSFADTGLDDLKSYNISLRGAHDFWMVPADGQIDLQLEVQDVNRNRSGGILAVSVSRGEQTLWQDAIGTSGSQDRGYGAMVPVSVRLKDLQPGVYRVRMMADDDVFIRKISTRNKHWVMGTRLIVGDVVGYSTSTNGLQVWTTARHLVAETFHKEGLQTITFGSASGKIIKTHSSVRIDRKDSVVVPVALSVPSGDARLVLDGYYALDPVAFFEPQPRKLVPETDATAEGLQAVITPYQKSQDIGQGWKKSVLSFDIPDNLENVRLVLSAPGLASRAGAVDVRSVEIKFIREPITWNNWWKLIISELKAAWRRL